jgi:hypothetical protein
MPNEFQPELPRSPQSNSVKECPQCGLVNPPSAEFCDCGYSFIAQAAQSSGVVSRGDDNPFALSPVDQVPERRGRLVVGPLMALICGGIAAKNWYDALTGQPYYHLGYAAAFPAFMMLGVAMCFFRPGELQTMVHGRMKPTPLGITVAIGCIAAGFSNVTALWYFVGR